MGDYMIRATAAEEHIRAFAAATRDMAEEARRIHNLSPVASAALGRTLTAGGMMGAMMKGTKDVLTITFDGDGPIGGITVTAFSNGDVKGYVKNPQVMLPANEKGKLDVGGAVGHGMPRGIHFPASGRGRREGRGYRDHPDGAAYGARHRESYRGK